MKKYIIGFIPHPHYSHSYCATLAFYEGEKFVKVIDLPRFFVIEKEWILLYSTYSFGNVIDMPGQLVDKIFIGNGELTVKNK